MKISNVSSNVNFGFLYLNPDHNTNLKRATQRKYNQTAVNEAIARMNNAIGIKEDLYLATESRGNGSGYQAVIYDRQGKAWFHSDWFCADGQFDCPEFYENADTAFSKLADRIVEYFKNH